MSSIGRREFLATTALALTARAVAAAAGQDAGCSTSPSRASATTSTTAASACSSTTSARLQVRQAHSDVERSGGPGARERQGHRGQRAARAGSTSRTHQAHRRASISLTEKMVWDKRARGRLRSPGDLARRHDALRAVVRGTALERLDARDGRVDQRRSSPTPARTTRSTRRDGTARVSGGAALAAAVGRRSDDAHRSSRPSARSRTSIRPFTVNAAQTRCYVNVNELLGFEVGDLTTGKKLHRVEVQGSEKGPVKRHGCPSHGIGLTPDERELWLCDGHNNAVHVFDNTVDAAEADVDDQGARSARLDHVQHRRPARVSVDRRGLRREDEEAEWPSLEDETGAPSAARSCSRSCSTAGG